jgi:Putative auto-transporter adhesin, head GIN domain
MNIKQSIMLTFSLFSLFSCFRGRSITGSGNIVKEKRAAGNFTGVSVSGIVPVEVKNGPVSEITVEADDNLLKYISTEVEGNVLKIRMKEFRDFRNCTFKVYVTTPTLNSLSCSGAGSVTSMGVLKDEKEIKLRLSGAGSINIDVDAPTIDASASGAGKMILTGRTKNYIADVSGASSINSFDLFSENANVEVSGASSVKVHASVKLKASASGAGDIIYRGAAVVESSASTAGKISKEQ